MKSNYTFYYSLRDTNKAYHECVLYSWSWNVLTGKVVVHKKSTKGSWITMFPVKSGLYNNRNRGVKIVDEK